MKKLIAPAALLLLTLLAHPGRTNTSVSPAPRPSCAPGYHVWDEDPTQCVIDKHPEPAIEAIVRQREWMFPRTAPFDNAAPGAYSNAVAQRQQLAAKPPKVSGTEGTWAPYGKGPLISNDAAYPSTNVLGLVYSAGRLDTLFYDQDTKRLFATKGTGGVWLSEDVGTTWRSIGDKLPSQIVAAVAYTKANGGTLVALSGDPATGSYTYSGFGAFYSNDLGNTWAKATGIPDGAPGFALALDGGNPSLVYAATLFGLYRSADGGKSYANVVLPTGPCAGVEGGTTGHPECLLANVVTDVVVKQPGGVTPTASAGTPVKAGTVLAVVGWRSGNKKNPDGTVQSPANGLYRSDTGAPNTFMRLGGLGFAPQDRIGRTDLGAAIGPQQNHSYVYAIVQDAVALNGGLEVLDTPEGVDVADPRPIGPELPVLGYKLGEAGGTVLEGVYVSPDFGNTWTLMADDNVIAKDPATGSALVGIGQSLGYEPGVQSWYNLWIAPDPTMQTVEGIPTRLAFGLEEVWQNDVTGQPLTGPTTFKVIGRYFSGQSCMLLPLGLPTCPTDRPPSMTTTTHPDQHASVWIPDGEGGVTLAVGNDGGFYKQHAAAGAELNNGGWGDGSQTGFNTLLPYDVAMAKDGTVYAGLQDNGHLKITPDGKQYSVYGGDGTYAEVDPTNSSIAYESTPGAGMKVTLDGGSTWRDMPPPITGARFVNPFEMDPTDGNHLLTAGRQVVETTSGPDTGQLGASWQQVFDLGTSQHPGDPSAVASATDPTNVVSALSLQADAAYVGFCGPCTHVNQQAPFRRGIATNVGGLLPGKRMTSAGWHVARAQGLPNRYVMDVVMDPANPKVVYAALGGYSVRWIPPGTLNDTNQNIGTGHLFRSTDAGETFVDVSGNLPDVPVTSVAIRGKQLLVGTDVGAFANDVRGGTTYAALQGLPVVPISKLHLKPGDCNTMVAATFGRGIWTYAFAKAVAGTNPCSTAGAGGTPLPAYAPSARIHSPTHAWWSGAAGYADSYMTRSIAIPANASSLKFWTWYRLEDGYDWAYALLSTDNGATWTSLVTTASSGAGTTPLDPVGTAGGVLGGNKKYPNGFTGTSGLAPTFTGQNTVDPVLVEESADLTGYTGKTVLLRFAYNGDPATNMENFYVDDVRLVDVLGTTLFSDNMENQATWTPGGTPGFRWVTAAP